MMLKCPWNRPALEPRTHTTSLRSRRVNREQVGSEHCRSEAVLNECHDHVRRIMRSSPARQRCRSPHSIRQIALEG